MDVDKVYRTKFGKKEQSVKQEKAVAKNCGGRTTLASGALHFDKGDVVSKIFRIECKRTDKEYLRIDSKWLKKITREAGRKLPAVAIDINGEEWYLIRPGEFAFLANNIEE